MPILYLSRYIIQNKADYYRLLLQATREQQWNQWIIYILKGIGETATWTTATIAAMRALTEHTTADVENRLTKVHTHAPVYLKQLADISVLVENAEAKEKLFIRPQLMQLLTRDRNDFWPYVLPTP